MTKGHDWETDEWMETELYMIENTEKQKSVTQGTQRRDQATGHERELIKRTSD